MSSLSLWPFSIFVISLQSDGTIAFSVRICPDIASSGLTEPLWQQEILSNLGFMRQVLSPLSLHLSETSVNLLRTKTERAKKQTASLPCAHWQRNQKVPTLVVL